MRSSYCNRRRQEDGEEAEGYGAHRLTNKMGAAHAVNQTSQINKEGCTFGVQTSRLCIFKKKAGGEQHSITPPQHGTNDY